MSLRRQLRDHLRDPLYRNSYFLMASAGLNATTGFAFWLLVAHLTSTRNVGIAAGIVSAVAFLSYLTSLGLPVGLLRHLPSGEDDLSAMVNVTFAISAATS